MTRHNLEYERLLQSQFDAPDEPDLAEFTQRLSSAMGRLAKELREGRKVRQENHMLRQENQELRNMLGTCVSCCERFLGPALETNDLDDEDHTRARAALIEGRRLLESPALLFSPVRDDHR